MKTFWQNPLLEDFVARDINTVDLVARAPHIGNELLLLIGEVLDLGPCVALSIGVDLQHVVGALASHEPATTNDVVLVTLVLEDVHVTETVLTELIASLNETRDEVAGLETNGTTEIEDIFHIERGYEDMEVKLRGLGADIVKRTFPDSMRKAL